ncbi:flagellar basal body-associated protein FliL [Phreatobacter aquaticus]|uniref:Flagellar protein FliL n=1 Tax=Phreatobacter aquaticus TaxID=2570229 RepID=A0A4D7QNK5_9HYPH|nr:flagellar basal body-associated protein FliL [Phreatobacter aquaticus]QCK88071.1 flagellar basal body-associated protein FliL [Phreatobacter aquaticus]
MAKKPKTPEGEGEDGEHAEAPAGGGKKKLIMIAGAVLVLAGGGGGWFFFMKKKPEATQAAPVEVAKPVAFVDLPDMTVNLSVGQDRPQYLRVKVALEVTDAKVADQIKPIMPRVVDAFQLYLREMRPADIEGSAGIFRLRDELTRRVNTAVHPARVNAVLFREIVVQ